MSTVLALASAPPGFAPWAWLLSLADASGPPTWLGYVLTIVGMCAAFLVFVVVLSIKLGDLLRVTKDTHAKVVRLEGNHERHSHLFTWLEARGFFNEDATPVPTETLVQPRKRTGHTNPNLRMVGADTTAGRAAIQPRDDDGDGET